MATLEQLQALEASFGATIQNLRNEIVQLRLARNSSSSPRPSRPKPILPDPEKFNGTTYRWDTWLPMIKAKLRLDCAAIGSTEAQFYYVYGNLESKVQAMVLPQLSQAEAMQLWDPQSILDQLARIYDDPNKKTKAASRLQSIRQGDDNLTAFLAKFERLLYEADANDWPSAAKIAVLRTSLSPTIQRGLDVQLSLPTEYDEFVKVLQILGSTSQGQGSCQTTFPRQGQSTIPGPTDAMDLGAIQVGMIEASGSKRLISAPYDSSSGSEWEVD